MKQQIWFCEVCHAVSRVPILEGTIGYVVQAIKDDHRETSPECSVPIEQIRVLSIENLLRQTDLPEEIIQPVTELLENIPD